MTIFDLEEYMRQEGENGLGLMEVNGQKSIGLKVNQVMDRVRTALQLLILVILGRMNHVTNSISPYAPCQQK